VNVLERRQAPLVDYIALLRDAVATTRRNHPFAINAFVVLLDRFACDLDLASRRSRRLHADGWSKG
jgi:putative transposase